MTGICRERFVDEVNEELICSICLQVLLDPVADVCEHFFCRTCILSWLACSETKTYNNNSNESDNNENETQQNKCPISGKQILSSELKTVPRIAKNLLSKLRLHCEFYSLGCEQIITYDQLKQHEFSCDFNPQTKEECSKNCGAKIRRDLFSTHDCIQHLTFIVEHLNHKIQTLWNIIEENRNEIFQLKCLLQKENLKHL